MNKTSSYIDHLPEAEYEVLESAGLSGAPSDAKNMLYSIIASLADSIIGGRRGWVFTAGISSTDLAKNPGALQNYYSNHSGVIDDYFEYIDLQKLAQMIGGDVQKTVTRGTAQWFADKAPAFVVGSLFGVGLLYLYNQKFS